MGYHKRHLIVVEEQDTVSNRYITITFKTEHQLSDCASKAVLVRLSDEDDLYFLYSASISDKDFGNIKSQQGLLVDFDGFSQRVVDLLELCRQDECNATPKYALKFSYSFECGKKIGVLRIIEATNFKYLTHLSLNLLAADDDVLKTYLVEQLKSLRHQYYLKCSELDDSLRRKCSQLSRAEELLMQTQKEFDEFRCNAEEKEKAAESSFKSKISELEEKLSSTIISLKNSATAERSLALESMEHLRSECTSKVNALELELKRLKEERVELTESLNNVKNELQTSMKKNDSLTEELTSLRSKLDSAEFSNHNQKTVITKLESRISVLENELSSRDHFLSKTQELLTNEQEQKSRLQDQLQRQTRHLEKVEKSLEHESEEVSKANEIIRRLQNEVKSHHTKAKLRGQVAAEQERLLSSKDTELQELRSELDHTKSELKASRETVDNLSNQVKLKSGELSEAQQTIKTNENIIGWLNRQISESQMGQMQQRLKNSVFTTPIPPLSNTHTRLLSPALGSVTNVGWHPTGVKQLSTNLNTSTGNPTTVVAPVASTANPGPILRCTSSMPSQAGASVLTSVTSNQIYPSTLPAPMTKSTPLHTDHVTLEKLRPSDRTMRPVRAMNNTVQSEVTTARLPSYLPSSLPAKLQTNQNQATYHMTSGITYPENTGPEVIKTTSTCSGPDDGDRTLHQQSLSSAYFPKPVGTGGLR